MTSSHRTSPEIMSSSPSPSLRRGQACLTCRRRKTKCDAARPACASCVREGLGESCTYQPPSDEASQLGRKVRELRSRLRQLERARIASEGTQSPISTSPSTSVRSSSGDGILTQHDTEHLVSAFFSDEQPLWFLHKEWFREVAMSSVDHTGSVHPALLATVCALGARSTSAWDYSASADRLMKIALSSVNQHLDSGGMQFAQNALHLIQARVLLGAVSMNAGQSLQGASLLSGACSLALALGLHNPHAGIGGIAMIPVPIGHPLPHANDVEISERTCAFWVAATLDRLWALALGSRARINLEALEVHTPLPQRPEHYAQTGQTAIPLVNRSLRELLSGTDPTSVYRPHVGNSLEIVSIVAYLYEQSVLIARGESSSLAVDVILARANSLAAELRQTSFADTTALAAYVLACGVSIQLYSPLGDPRAGIAARELASAAPALRIATSGPGLLEIAIGLVVPEACMVIRSSSGWTSNLNTPGYPPSNDLQLLRGVLEHWAPRSVYIQSRLSRLP
ncbi:unnamed protein product [Peniophora sp. CBMAI 1063]|nr:unnamed protein product [Peniophora sp. CBMAI 1063]